MSITVEKLGEELQFLSNRLSEQTRTVALGLLAVSWLFLAGGTAEPALPAIPDRGYLQVVVLLCLATLLADHLQYLFGYLNCRQLHRSAEAADQGTAEFDSQTWLYRLRTWLFWIKQVLSVGATIMLAAALINAITTSPTPPTITASDNLPRATHSQGN